MVDLPEKKNPVLLFGIDRIEMSIHRIVIRGSTEFLHSSRAMSIHERLLFRIDSIPNE
jgi:hypothetical protein